MSNKRASVRVTEIDLSQLVEASPAGVPAGVLGTADRGPAFVPVLFDDLSEWQTRFGSAEGHLGAVAASEWLAEGDSALYVRLLGVGNGNRRLGEGNVPEAGFVVGEDNVYDVDPSSPVVNPYAYAPASGPQIPGRTYFLGAMHRDKPDSDFLGRAFSFPLSNVISYPVVRAVLFTPKGVAASLFNSSSAFKGEPLEDELVDPLEPSSYGTGTNDLGGAPFGSLVRSRNSFVTSRLYLNGHISTPEWGNDIEFSFDPRSSVYLTKVLNTDPEKIQEAGHCLYAWWEVDPALVDITVERETIPEIVGGDVVTPGAFCFPASERGGLEFPEGRPNYENFEERYAEPLSPWIYSEELPGGERKKLFRVHVVDSGEGANTAYKVAISNIRRAKDEWTRFDLTLRRWDDSDSDPVVLENFSGLDLDPNSRNYIARRIGDTRLKYIWDANPDNQGLLREGLYESRSRRIWIEVSDEVEAGLDVPDLVPVAHEGLPHIVVDGFDGSDGLVFMRAGFQQLAFTAMPFSLEDNVFEIEGTTTSLEFDLNDSTLFNLGAHRFVLSIDSNALTKQWFNYDDSFTDYTALQSQLQAFFDDPSVLGSGAAAVAVVWGQVTITFSVPFVGTIEAFTALDYTDVQAIPQISSMIRQAPVPFRDTLAKDRRTTKINPRIHWGFKFNIPNVSRDGSLANWSKFFPDFGDIPFWSRDGEAQPDPIFGSVLSTDAYNNNIFTLERVLAPVDGSDNVVPAASAWSDARYVRDGVDPGLTGLRFVRASDLQSSAARPYLKFSFPVVGGFDGVNILDRERKLLTDTAVLNEQETGFGGAAPVDPDDISNPRVGPTSTTWLKGAEILGSNEDVDVQILVTPGLRHRAVTNEICRLTEERLDAVYLLDPEIMGDEDYTVDVREVNLEATLARWQERELDNTFVGAYFPDVILPNPASGRIKTVPGSVAALGAFSRSDVLSEPWFPAAGATRGQLPRVEGIPVVLSDTDQDSLYNSSINPIVDKPSFGPLVWGNKTTRQTESVLNRINVRRLLIEIRRRVRTVAKDFLFEPNLPETLARFQGLVTPILADIQQKRGVQKFVVFIDTTTTTQLDIENGLIRGIIGVQPTQSAEFAEIDFEIRNNAE